MGEATQLEDEGSVHQVVKSADGGEVSIINTKTGGVEVAYYDKHGKMVGQPEIIDGTSGDIDEIADTFNRYAQGGATLRQLKEYNAKQAEARIEDLRASIKTQTQSPKPVGKGSLASKLFGGKR